MLKNVFFAAVAGVALTSPVAAASLPFAGTFNNTNPPAAPGGRCAGLTVNIAPVAPFYSTGTSNFGEFSSVQSHCLNAGPPVAIGAADVPYLDGLFTFSFVSGATLSGTYDGLLSNAGTMGLIDNIQHFVITGGTGLFADATGSFLGTGNIRFGNGPPAATLTISDGVINVGAVPEPATWAMLTTGFAAAGLALRRRKVAGAA